MAWASLNENLEEKRSIFAKIIIYLLKLGVRIFRIITVLVSSNRLDLRSVWKSLVASCVCVWLKFERAFSTRSSPARNGFVSSSITRSSSN